MRQPRSDSALIALDRKLHRLRSECRRLRSTDCTSWSTTIEETNNLAREIGRVQPSGIADLVI